MKKLACLFLLLASASWGADLTASDDSKQVVTRAEAKTGYVTCRKCAGCGRGSDWYSPCPRCDGHGGFRLVKCRCCKGAGVVTEYRIEYPEPGKSQTEIETLCPECHGTGKFLVPAPKPKTPRGP